MKLSIGEIIFEQLFYLNLFKLVYALDYTFLLSMLSYKVHEDSNIFETSKLVSLEVLPIIISNELLTIERKIHYS